jgi:TetR/AcrR family transcriptional regulator, transcriptional repressor for nem operon
MGIDTAPSIAPPATSTTTATATATPPTGKRLTRKGEETRRRIVAAAAQLMYERGLTEATLEDVRAAAGVSGSQIYHYFADKQALLLAVIDYQTEAVLEQQAPHFDRLDTMDGLRAWRDSLVEYQRRLQCRGGCPIGSLGSEVAENNPEARLAVASGFLRWEAAIRTGLAAMHERGELDGDPEDLALATLAALQGGLLLTQIQRTVRPLEVALDAMLDHIQSRTRKSRHHLGGVAERPESGQSRRA